MLSRSIRRLLSRWRENRWLKKHKDDPELPCQQPVRAYCLCNGDTFVVDSRHLFDVFAASNFDHLFVPIRVHKKSIWYKPATWFRACWEIEYRENPDVKTTSDDDEI